MENHNKHSYIILMWRQDGKGESHCGDGRNKLRGVGTLHTDLLSTDFYSRPMVPEPLYFFLKAGWVSTLTSPGRRCIWEFHISLSGGRKLGSRMSLVPINKNQVLYQPCFDTGNLVWPWGLGKTGQTGSPVLCVWAARFPLCMQAVWTWHFLPPEAMNSQGPTLVSDPFSH